MKDNGSIIISDHTVEDPGEMSFFNNPTMPPVNLHSSMSTLIELYSEDDISEADKTTLTQTAKLLKDELTAEDLHTSMLFFGELETYATDLDSILLYCGLLNSAQEEAVKLLEELDA